MLKIKCGCPKYDIDEDIDRLTARLYHEYSTKFYSTCLASYFDEKGKVFPGMQRCCKHAINLGSVKKWCTVKDDSLHASDSEESSDPFDTHKNRRNDFNW